MRAGRARMRLDLAAALLRSEEVESRPLAQRLIREARRHGAAFPDGAPFDELRYLHPRLADVEYVERGDSADRAAMPEVPLAPGTTTHALYVADGWRPPVPGEVEWLVEAAPEVSITRAHRGREGRGVQTHFGDASGAPLDVSVAWSGPPVPAEKRNGHRGIVVAVIVFLLAALALVARRRLSGSYRGS